MIASTTWKPTEDYKSQSNIPGPTITEKFQRLNIGVATALSGSQNSATHSPSHLGSTFPKALSTLAFVNPSSLDSNQVSVSSGQTTTPPMDNAVRKRFLEFLDLSGDLEPTTELLFELQQRHVERIPWENLDVFFEREFLLNPNQIVQKYWNQHRGGICFELNGSYHSLLCALGFKAHLVGTTLFGFNSLVFNQPTHSHIAIIVEINNSRYLTDVAWNGWRKPISLQARSYEDITGAFQLSLIDSQPQTYLLEKLCGDKRFKQYSFDLKPITLESNEPFLDFASAPPDSFYAHGISAMKYGSDGSKMMLHKNELHVSDAEGTTKVIGLNNTEELTNVLIDTFSIDKEFVEEQIALHQAKFKALFNET